MSDKDSGGKKGSSLFGLVKFALFLFVLLVILSYVFGRVVPPGYMGVRQVTLDIPGGLKQGFSEKGLPPGYHWNIPFYTKIHLVPQDIQLIHIHKKTAEYPYAKGPLEVQTTDGASVLVDVSIMSRFYREPGALKINGEKVLVEGKEVLHGGPGDLLRELGPSEKKWRDTVVKDSINELKRALGSLSTSEFYDPYKREKEVKIASREINLKLAKWGARIEGLLLRRYIYSERRIDEAIFAKNLQDQEERLNAAASKLAEAKATLEQVAAEMDAKIETLKVKGENKAKVIRSEADLYETEQIAKGDLLVAKAKAEADKLKASVLAQTQGADEFVAREMAALVGSLEGGVIADVDPYDISAWLRRFGLEVKSDR